LLLREAIQCALAQAGVRLDIIVVDDGSEDGTRAAVERSGDPRVRMISNERSEGVASARNRGIAQAMGTWIAFLDDDDLWAPEKLCQQIGAARDAGAGWAYAGAVSVDENLRLISRGPPPEKDEALRQLPFRNVIPAGASNVVVRRDILRRAGLFDPELRHMADWDLWIRLARLGPPAVVRGALVAYRIHRGNASLDPAGIEAEIHRIEERYSDSRAGLPIDRAYVYRWIAWSRMRAGDRSGAVRAYWKAMRSGDLFSIGRAVIAVLHPRVTGPPVQRSCWGTDGDAAWPDV